MDEAKQMTVEEALDAADQIVGFYDGDPYDLIERGCDTLEVLAAEVRRLTAEVEMLRGVGCSEMDGSEMRGPCGVCLKCARRERDEARAALATARREGAEETRRIPLKIYLVEGNVIAARSVREAAAIAEDQCGDAGPITGPLAGGTTVPVGTTTGEVVQIPVGKLLASGVQRGVVTRALPLDAPGGAT